VPDADPPGSRAHPPINLLPGPAEIEKNRHSVGVLIIISFLRCHGRRSLCIAGTPPPRSRHCSSSKGSLRRILTISGLLAFCRSGVSSTPNHRWHRIVRFLALHENVFLISPSSPTKSKLRAQVQFQDKEGEKIAARIFRRIFEGCLRRFKKKGNVEEAQNGGSGGTGAAWRSRGEIFGADPGSGSGEPWRKLSANTKTAKPHTHQKGRAPTKGAGTYRSGGTRPVRRRWRRRGHPGAGRGTNHGPAADVPGCLRDAHKARVGLAPRRQTRRPQRTDPHRYLAQPRREAVRRPLPNTCASWSTVQK